jgi:hypothetical protein
MSANEIEVPMLQVGDLYTKRQKRDTARLKAYNEILEQIYHRIRVSSQLPTHPAHLLYTIPPFIFGLPKIELEDCVVYLVYQLRSAGFEVRYTYPNLIFISWKHHEKNYLLQESPILQAMLATSKAAAAAPPPPPPFTAPSKQGALKPARKVTFSTEASAAQPRGRLQPFQPFSQEERPKKDVTEYKPPKGLFGFDRAAINSSADTDGQASKFKSLFDF